MIKILINLIGFELSLGLVNAPWRLPVTTLCTGDRNTCCPQDGTCEDDQMELYGDTCIANADPSCSFSVEGTYTDWWLHPNGYLYGCFNKDGPTIYASLPYNVMNSDDIWNSLNIRISRFNMNNTRDCLTTEWYAQVVEWPPVVCDSITDVTVDDLIILTTDQITIRRIRPKDQLTWKSKEWDDDLFVLEFDLSQILGDRRYGDKVGVRLQPFIGTTCNIVLSTIKDDYDLNNDFPYPDHVWIREGALIYYNASGTTWGLKNATVLIPPADLTLPANLTFQRPPAYSPDLYLPNLLQTDNNTSTNFSSCDPEILKDQIADIRAGSLKLNPDCNYSKLYEVFFVDVLV